MQKQTIKEAGFRYVKYDRDARQHILYNTNADSLEVWATNYFNNGTLKWKNTELEFLHVYAISSQKKKEILRQHRKRSKVTL